MGRGQAAHGLRSGAGRTAGGQGYHSEVNKAFLPHMKKINTGGGAGRGRVCRVKFNQSNSYKELNKALYLSRTCLSACKPFKLVSGCTGKLCSSGHSFCVTFIRGFPKISMLSGKKLRALFR